jgi:hypothetical protein
MAFIQLEKHNERLKEALIRYNRLFPAPRQEGSSVDVSFGGRLRDVSSETEKAQRQRIAELEKDVSHGEDLLGDHLFVVPRGSDRC